jgi:bifunctional UDP-N-acetylglucosamine pyrophosphorylase/glucosamine-1-phosphate N-acetyltransferase
MDGEELSILILAAGKGTRMLSDKAKVLHELSGLPILEYILRATAPLRAGKTILIIGHQKELVRERFTGRELVFVEQEKQLGTGHAVFQARQALEDNAADILILPGDLPLLRAELLERFVAFHRGHSGRLSLLAIELSDPSGYGRIVRGGTGVVQRIVEEKDATAERGICEVNSGIYLVRNDQFFWEALSKLDDINAQREYYLTDIVPFYWERGETVQAMVVRNEVALLGVNSRADLARAEGILRERKLGQAMDAGVTIVVPEEVMIEQEVQLEQDVTVRPGSSIKGRSRIRRGALIEGAQVEGFEVGEGSKIIKSLIRAQGRRRGSEE